MPTNFLWYPGPSGNTGLLTSTLNLMTTELNSLASGSGVISSVNGVSGVFNTSNTGQGIWGDVWWQLGATATTAFAAGANISGWFLSSYNGTNFETPTATVAPQRPPDYMLSMGSGVLAANSYIKAIGIMAVKYPAFPFKTYVQNNTGVALPNETNGGALIAALGAIQY